ncbi:hypothetical protein PENSPDRAFT_672325 [Peniophora sp. CONT]|nr:hypothetical protein PENSPDRAFT_672325 [Peniophora sp. CONT]
MCFNVNFDCQFRPFGRHLTCDDLDYEHVQSLMIEDVVLPNCVVLVGRITGVYTQRMDAMWYAMGTNNPIVIRCPSRTDTEYAFIKFRDLSGAEGRCKDLPVYRLAYSAFVKEILDKLPKRDRPIAAQILKRADIRFEGRDGLLFMPDLDAISVCSEDEADDGAGVGAGAGDTGSLPQKSGWVWERHGVLQTAPPGQSRSASPSKKGISSSEGVLKVPGSVSNGSPSKKPSNVHPGSSATESRNAARGLVKARLAEVIGMRITAVVRPIIGSLPRTGRHRMPSRLPPPANAPVDWLPVEEGVALLLEAAGVNVNQATWTIVRTGNVLGISATETAACEANVLTSDMLLHLEHTETLIGAIELWRKLVANKGLARIPVFAKDKGKRKA